MFAGFGFYVVTGSNSFGGNGQLYSSVVDNQSEICELTDDADYDTAL